MNAGYTATSVELFHNGKRVALHARSSAAYRHTTIHEHMPKSHLGALRVDCLGILRLAKTYSNERLEA
ncbi:MAG: hypothetical protein JO108_27550 [Acidobacteriaceae bacterium]|nr:hypothetical protein [Acidobacteriaceae bacterium]